MDPAAHSYRAAFARLTSTLVLVAFLVILFTVIPLPDASSVHDLAGIALVTALACGIAGFALGFTIGRVGIVVSVVLSLIAMLLLTVLTAVQTTGFGGIEWRSPMVIAAVTILPATVFGWAGWQARINRRMRGPADLEGA